jgi:anaerobic selenocysteine-containing dehydrogenase
MTEEKITYCRICEVYCGLVATVEDGRVTRLRPDKHHVVSHGYSCPKGITFDQVTHDPDRIVHPMKKVGGSWQRISWEQALGEIAERLNFMGSVAGGCACIPATPRVSGSAMAHGLSSAVASARSKSRCG